MKWKGGWGYNITSTYAHKSTQKILQTILLCLITHNTHFLELFLERGWCECDVFVHKLCQRRERKRIVCFPWNLFHDWGEPRSCHSQKIVLIVSITITTKTWLAMGNGYGERDDAQHIGHNKRRRRKDIRRNVKRNSEENKITFFLYFSHSFIVILIILFYFNKSSYHILIFLMLLVHVIITLLVACRFLVK